jgi:hypothetical protein
VKHLNHQKAVLIWVISGYASPVGTSELQDQILNKIEQLEENDELQLNHLWGGIF